MADGAGDYGSDLATQIANLLRQNVYQQPSNPKLSDNLQINIKLNSQNYALWTRMIRVAIGGKSKTLLNHLAEKPTDKLTSEHKEVWEQEDLIIFLWLIQNIEPNIAGNLTEYPTSKALWDALVVTYSSGKDKLQAFNLYVKANEFKQGDKTLEEFWISPQSVWGEIDRIDPNPIKNEEDIQIYTQIRSEQKLFQFFNGIDQKFEPTKREILRVDPLPTVEAAYDMIRKEAAHQVILGATSNDNHGLGTEYNMTFGVLVLLLCDHLL